MPSQNVLNQIVFNTESGSVTYRVGTVNGYYNESDGKFYLEPTYVTEVQGAENLVYADLGGDALYVYKNSISSFVKVSGAGEAEIIHVDTLPTSPDIQDRIYEYGHNGETTTVEMDATALNAVPFLDQDAETQWLVKPDYAVTTGSSTSHVTAITYNGTGNEYIIIREDASTETKLPNANVNFTIINNKAYYLGDEVNQILVGFDGGYSAGSGINISSNNMISVVNRLEEVNELPSANIDLIGKHYLLTATQTGYVKDTIYVCRQVPESDPATYEWVNIDSLTLGTAAFKNYTDLVRPNSHDLVESGSVYSAIANAVSTVFVPHGNITCAEFVPALLIPDNVGNLYTVTDSGVTTSDFMGGAGQTINVGDTVGIINAGPNIYLFNLMPGLADLSKYENVYYGYLNTADGRFYKESTYVTEITAKVNALYVAVDTWKTYAYDLANTEYVLVGGDAEIIHVDTLPSVGDIENKIYEYGHAGDTYTMTNTGQSAIDVIPCFEESSTADTYNVKATYEVIVNDKNVDNVVYDTTDSKFVINFDDTTNLDVIFGDSVTFVVLNNREYYLGDATNQTYTQINDYVAGSGIQISPEHTVSVVNRLEEKSLLPAPSADYANKYFLLTDEQTGFNKGYIYLCQQIPDTDPAEYEWIQTIESGSSGGGLTYVQSLPVSPNIQNVIYGYYATVEDKEPVADDFLDNIEGFDKENDTYLPKNGYTITASSDMLTYKILTSLAKITGGYEATYEDTTNETFNTGDTFYYTVSHMDFYAGDSENQTLYLLAGAGNGGGSGASGGVINGYLNPTDGKFYADASYTTEIPGKIGLLYLDVSTNRLYRYDDFNVKFILVGDIEYTAGTGIDITNGVISGDYQDGFGIEIDGDEIKTRDFVGTQADWNSLTSAQQAEYDFVHITDDSSSIVYKPGHSISDGTTEKTQRDGLVFDGFEVTDDSANEVTKIAEIPYTAGDGIDITNKEVSVGDEISRTWTGTKAEWDAIVDKSVYDGWIINITDDAAVGSGPVVDVVEDGNLNAVTSNATYDALQTIVKNSLVHAQGTLPSSTGTTGEIYTLSDNNYILVGYAINAANPTRKVMNTMHLELYIRESDNKVCAYLDAGGSGYVSNTIDLYFIKL